MKLTEIDAKIVFHVSDSVNPGILGGGGGGGGRGGSQEGRRLVSVNNPSVIRLFTYM